MTNEELQQAFQSLSTALIADAGLQIGSAPRVAPLDIRPVEPGWKAAGRARAVRHQGSVDVFFAALDASSPGDVLVVDDGGRRDQACIGELVALEAAAAGIAGIIIWGCHRDTAGLVAIDLPIFSLRSYPAGPRRAIAGPPGPRGPVQIGTVTVSGEDIVFADDDGVLFVAADSCRKLVPVAAELCRREQTQADAVATGVPLRVQLRYQEYASLKARDPAYTFREHLRRIGGAIEG